MNEIGRQIIAHSGDSRATAFLKQRLEMAVRRGNAAAILETLSSHEEIHENDA